MNYNPDEWDKWTPTPRETPPWLKRAEYKAPLPFKKKRPIADIVVMLCGVALILFALLNFSCELAKSL